MPNPKKKPKQGSTPEKPAHAEESYDPTGDRHVLRELITRTGACPAAKSAAFATLIDDDGRAALGGKTRARGVFHDAVTWAVIIDDTFTKYGESLKEYYPKDRFAYYLDCAAALDEAVSAQESHRGSQGDRQTSAEQQELATRAARDKLIFKLERVAGRRAAERAALVEAKGRLDTKDALGESILALVTLGRSWHKRVDATSKALCEAAGLTDALLDEAVEAARSFTGAAKDVSLAGRRRAADSPEVNLLEGTLLHEMEEAMICLETANLHTKVIPRLTPGSATRHVLGTKKSSKKADEPAKEGEGTKESDTKKGAEGKKEPEAKKAPDAKKDADGKKAPDAKKDAEGKKEPTPAEEPDATKDE